MCSIGGALCLFSGRERVSFECALSSHASYIDKVAKLLMDLVDVSGEQCLDAVQTVVNDGLIVGNPIEYIRMLNQNILQLVNRLLKFIYLLIECHDMIKERGKRSGLRGGEAWFDMWTIAFASTSKFFGVHILNEFPGIRGSFKELNMLQGGWSNDRNVLCLYEFMVKTHTKVLEYQGQEIGIWQWGRTHN